MNVPDGVTEADEYRARWCGLVHKLGQIEDDLDDQQTEILDESLDQIELLIDAAADEIEERGRP